MKEHKAEIRYYEATVEDLSPLDFELMTKAVDAAQAAYAPYSNFHVGAAVMLTNGRIITGNNQENAAYPSGMCAERVALFSAMAQCPDAAIRDLVIVATKDGVITSGISPCGACRQVMLEYERKGGSPMRILLCGKEQVLVLNSAASLLPLAFTGENLE